MTDHENTTVRRQDLGEPMLTFAVEQLCAAPPDAVYDVLARPSTHLAWAGRETAKADGLYELEAEGGVADVGAVFTSSGGRKPGKDTFHDRSVVVTAEPGRAFAFSTQSRMDRGSTKEWRARFEHRYDLVPQGGSTLLRYTCEVRPENYRPYWLHPAMRPLTRAVMQRTMMTPHLRNLAALVARP